MEEEYSLSDLKPYLPEKKDEKIIVEKEKDQKYYLEAANPAKDLLRCKRDILDMEQQIYDPDLPQSIDVGHLQKNREGLLRSYTETIGRVFEAISNARISPDEYLAKIREEQEACQEFIAEKKLDLSNLIGSSTSSDWENNREDIAKFNDRLDALILLADEISRHSRE